MGDALRVVAHLASPLGGDPPHLDSLLVSVRSRLLGKDAPAGSKLDKDRPLPVDRVPTPLAREQVGGVSVALCSSPILPVPTSDTVEYVAKRLGVEHAELIDPAERRIVTTTNGWTKSHRLPIRVRTVPCVAWLCVGDRRELRKVLKYVPAVGKKVADGYGRIDRWEVDRLDFAPLKWWPWWIKSDAGPVLMRPLPLFDGLPRGLLGARRDYCAVSDPYWHPDRFAEAVTPC